MWRAISQMCAPSKLDRSIWIISPVSLQQLLSWVTVDSKRVLRGGSSERHAYPGASTAPRPQFRTAPASVLLTKDPSVSCWRAQHLSSSLRNQFRNRQKKQKKINMETRLGWTNERTAWSKLLSLIGWLYCEAIFRSYVTGVYQSWNLSTDHLLFCFHTLWDT